MGRNRKILTRNLLQTVNMLEPYVAYIFFFYKRNFCLN